jgi:hypothetical protein
MKTKLLLLSILMFNTAYSQWSTSPYADSGLYVCPGFDPGIVTFDDGSSIVLGLLSSYIYAQKLDPAGYKVWPQPVEVFHNSSSDMVIGDNSERTWFCSDGDGGVILFWQDYRMDTRKRRLLLMEAVVVCCYGRSMDLIILVHQIKII